MKSSCFLPWVMRRRFVVPVVGHASRHVYGNGDRDVHLEL